MNNKFLFLLLNISITYSNNKTAGFNQNEFFSNFFQIDNEIENIKKKDFFNLDTIKGNIISNIVNDKNNLLLLTEINKCIFIYTYNFSEKKSSYISLNIKKQDNYKIAISKNYLCFINERGYLNIYNLLEKKIINIPKNFITPIYHLPCLIEKENQLEIYLLHAYDVVSKLIIENIHESEEKYKIYRETIHQQPYYNNIYYNFNQLMFLVEKFLIFPSKDGYIYVYENNKFLWRKYFGGNFSPLFNIIYIDNIPYIFGSNLYNNQVFLYNLKKEKIWSHNITSVLNNIYYNNHFVIVDIKNNIYFLNKEGKIIFQKDLLKLLKKNNSFSKIFNYFVLNKKFIFFTDNGIFIVNKDLKTYKTIYLNVVSSNNNSINIDNKYIFFITDNKLFKI